jgi:hypothetical protein
MKKIILLAACTAAISASALPTYEPFTEYASAIAATGTNAIDLCTAGVSAPSGEKWGNLAFSGTFGSGLVGIDILVTNNPGLFTATALGTILPSTFPGFPATGQSITNMLMNPAQPLVAGAANANIVGNSAILIFNQDVTRPATGTKTVYMSYLFSLAQQGQLGTGNDARYLGFVASSNTIEGKGTSGYYQNWATMLDTPSTAISATHAVLQDGTGFYVLPCDNSKGKEVASSPFVGAYNGVQFIVSAYTFGSAGAKDTNIMWVNPTGLGGAIPPTASIAASTMATNMSDIGGLVINDRPGKGAAAGGLGSNYMANLIIGTTWSYVTGGPEFTAQPTNISGVAGANYTLNGTAVAAGQNVSYQWKRIVGGATNNVNNGANGAGGGATVSGATSATLTLMGASFADAGTYELIATASGTGYTLASSSATISIADPVILNQPANAIANYGGSATFTTVVQTATAQISYAWYFGSTMLANGTQADGSTVSGATGTSTVSNTTLSLVLSNVSYLDSGSYTLVATNTQNNTVTTVPATLTVNDPYIITQPVNQFAVTGNNSIFTVTAAGSPTLSYAWQSNGVALTDVPGVVAGSQTPSLTLLSVSDPDDASYTVTVTNSVSGSNVTSIPATLLVEHAPVVINTLQSRVMGVGTHAAFAVSGSGGNLSYQWSFDNSPIAGATGPSLSITNLQLTNSGTYSVLATNLAGSFSSSATLLVSNGLFPLSTKNIEVARVGDGAEPLNQSSGNTLYLDQIAPGGGYVNTIMIPDSLPEGVAKPGPALLEVGVVDGIYESVLNLSGNLDYINVAGYCLSKSVSGNINSEGGNYVRALGAINGLGYYEQAYTNFGLYSASTAIRSVYSTDGLTNFWTTGMASSAGVKYVNAGPLGASYAEGNGIPSVVGSGAGTRVVESFNGNLIYSDVLGSSGIGIYGCLGLPMASAGSNILINTGAQFPSASPNDFAISPDGQTVYIADDEAFAGSTGGGGIERWDTNNAGGFSYSYTLGPIGLDGATNGARSVTVDFSASASWGSGVNGAIIYATSAAASTNSLVELVDNGGSTPPTITILDTAGPNQLLRGVRFGAAQVPGSIVSAPQSITNFAGQTAVFTVVVAGDQPFGFQWLSNGVPIGGAVQTVEGAYVQSALVLTNETVNYSATYTVQVTNALSTNSAAATLTVIAGPPILTEGGQNFVETVGDHLAFVAENIAGAVPMTFQWSRNGQTISSATANILAFTNIQLSNSGTYVLTIANQFGTNSVTNTLQVTSSLQSLSTANLILARVGDGVEPLSDTNGDTLYLDQLTTSGGYVNTIMIPDSGSAALTAAGGSTDGIYESVLNLSANDSFLNFGGFNVSYPYTGPLAKLSSGGNMRAFGAVDAFGYYALAEDNSTVYNVGPEFRSVVSQDGLAEFWTTGYANSPGIKYCTQGTAGPAGGIPTVTGSDHGTRVVQIINGNIVYTDVNSSPIGLFAVAGLATGTSTSNLFISEPTGSSPNDFAISPDQPAGTIYIADDNSIAGGGGIQRYDFDGSAYNYSYTLGTGNFSTAGARCLTADFSANGAWGSGVTGAIIYATTAEANGNRLISIVDNGPGSPVTVLSTAKNNQLYRGVRFGPAPAQVSIVSNPQPQSNYIGGSVVFSVVAGAGPFTYQWQLNNANLTDGQTIPGSGATVIGSQTGSLTISNIDLADQGGQYSVTVNNSYPSSTTSGSAQLTVLYTPVLIATNAPLAVVVTNGGTAIIPVGVSGGAPITIQWYLNGDGTALANGPSPQAGSSANISIAGGNSNSTLTISGASAADNGSQYYFVASNPGTSTNNQNTLTTLYVVSSPQFAGSAPITSQGGGSLQLNVQGTAGSPYRIWASTNLSLTPITSTWTPVYTNTFSGGVDNVPLTTTKLYQFYVITQP